MPLTRHRATSTATSTATVAAICAVLALPAIALPAQSAPAASRQQTLTFAIPAGSLEQALVQFSARSGVTVSYAPALVEGLRAERLSGEFTADDALRRLLAGSGLQARALANGSYSLSRAEQGVLPPVKVNADELSDGLPAEFTGGQVASGTRLGILGNLGLMETPFNATGYTTELIADQHARSVADLLVNNDASVRLIGGRADINDDYTIRGFNVQSRDVAFNGLYGVLPYWRVPIEFAERIELLRGPSAALGGMPPSGGVGGTINVVPKRAAEVPLTRITLDYTSDSQVGTHLDLGRRFGTDQRYGVRFNGVHRQGDTALEDQSREFSMASVALDYRGEKLRLATDILLQAEDLDGIVRPILVMPGVGVPEAPDTSRVFGMKNSYSDQEMLSIVIGAEYAVSDNLELFATLGGRQSDWDVEGANILLSDSATGDMFSASARQRADRRTYSGRAGLRGHFATGVVRHEVTVSLNRLDHTQGLIYEFYPLVPGNLYAPPIDIHNDTSALGGDIPTTEETILSGLGVTDRLFLLEDKLQLTLGARRQWVEIKTSDDKDQAWTPVAGIAYMPTTHLTFYANAIEGLSQGEAAPATANNPGTRLEPYKTEQYELGVKYDSGSFGASGAIFQIEKPSAFVGSDNVFRENGEQRNRGLELNTFGEPWDGVSILAGVSVINAEQLKTQGGAHDGNDASGVPERQANIGIDWDLPFAPGASVNLRWIYTGEAWLDAANTLKVSSWDRYDLGAKYRFNAGGMPVVVRANVENLLDDSYWQTSSFYEGLTISAPRTVTLSLTADF